MLCDPGDEQMRHKFAMLPDRSTALLLIIVLEGSGRLVERIRDSPSIYLPRKRKRNESKDDELAIPWLIKFFTH